jgi:hypothetical protein
VRILCEDVQEETRAWGFCAEASATPRFNPDFSQNDGSKKDLTSMESTLFIPRAA